VAEHAALRGLTIKAVVVLGFSITLGVWLVAGYRSAQRMAAVQEEAQQVSTRYARAQDLLSTVRAQVLLASVYIRDALLDPAPSPDRDYHNQIEAAYEVIRRALDQYSPLIDSPVTALRPEGLRREIEIYHATILDVLGEDATPGRDVRLFSGRGSCHKEMWLFACPKRSRRSTVWPSSKSSVTWPHLRRYAASRVGAAGTRACDQSGHRPRRVGIRVAAGTTHPWPDAQRG
jgi:hypothetical protein